jgi:hypothetical protein
VKPAFTSRQFDEQIQSDVRAVESEKSHFHLGIMRSWKTARSEKLRDHASDKSDNGESAENDMPVPRASSLVDSIRGWNGQRNVDIESSGRRSIRST